MTSVSAKAPKTRHRFPFDIILQWLSRQMQPQEPEACCGIVTMKRLPPSFVWFLLAYTVLMSISWSSCQFPAGQTVQANNKPTIQTKGNGASLEMQKYSMENSPQITTSSISKRRFLATVTSMPDADDRRAVFYDAWKRAWPDLQIFPSFSFKNHADLMGYALLTVNVLAMHKALHFANQTGQDFDYLMIFEDDALPFENTTWPADLDAALDEFEAKNGGGLYLGCHAVYSWERKKLVQNNGNINSTIAELVWAYGSYAWMIPRPRLRRMYNYFSNQVLAKKVGQWDGASDTSAHQFFMDTNIGHYVTVPLLVDHQSHGVSKTMDDGEFKTAVKKWYNFEGKRDWWNFDDNIGIFKPKGLPRMDNRGETHDE